MQVQRSTHPTRFEVSADGHGATGRAGLALLAEAADRLGLTGGLAQGAGASRRWSRHDPGVVLRDVILMLVDGGDALRHMSVLAGQPALFGTPASAATTCRTLKAVAADPEAMAGVATARRATRARVWALGGAPPEVTAAWARAHDRQRSEEPGEPLVLDLDATICIAHSDDKDGAAATYKHSWGFHPLLAYLDRGDGRGEALAGRLRPGNAGSNHAGDHITVFEDARAQLPDLPDTLERLVRCDSAGATHDFLAHVVERGWRFSVGFPLYEAVKLAIRALPEERWMPASDRQGEPRTNAAVAELTGLDLVGWPAGSRLLVRREPLHPGAQQTFDDVDGCRFTCLLTNQPGEQLARLEQRHRARARVEDWIRAAKEMGLRTLPLDTFARNALWLQLVLAAQDLMWFTQVLTLAQDELRLAEPQQLRYKLLHLPARLTYHARRWRLRLQHNWPWAAALHAAFQRLRALPAG